MRYICFNGDYISKLALGTVQFGLDYGIANKDGKPTQKIVEDIIEYLSKNGLNCFDTAQAYGSSEEVLGSSIINIKEKYVISKLKSDLFTNGCVNNLEESLKNLQLNELFALLLHDSTLLYNWENKYTNIVKELKTTKKIKYFGVSIYTNDDFNLAVENDSIDFIQIPFNLFDQRALTHKWFDKAKEKNKLIFIRSVFLQGLLLMDKEVIPDKLKNVKSYIDKLEHFCLRKSLTKNELALSFVDSVAQDALILFGCDNLSQAKENLSTYNNLHKLDDIDIDDLKIIFNDIDEDLYNPTKW